MTQYSNYAEQAAFNMKQRLTADAEASSNQAKDAAQRMRARIEGGGVGQDVPDRYVNGVKVYDGDSSTPAGSDDEQRWVGGNTPELRTNADGVMNTGSAQPLSIEARDRAAELIETGNYQQQGDGSKGVWGRDLINWVDKDGGTISQQLLREGYSAPMTGFDEQGRGWDNEKAYAESLTEFDLTGSTKALREQKYDYGTMTADPGMKMWDRRGFAERAWDRGIDHTQMNLYQFSELMGEVTGSDMMADWGEEGVIRNMHEAAMSPADVATTDDIKSLTDVGKFIIEKTIENAPNLLVDLGVGAAAAATVVATGGLASSLVAPALVARIGKSFVGKLGWKAAGTFGVQASMFGQMAGEARHGQLEAGVDNPLLALGVGAVNTTLEFKGMESMLKGFMPTGKITNAAAMASHIAQRAVVSTGVEGGTEFLQDLNNQLAIKLAKPTHEIDWNQLTESFFAGAAAGGGMGAISGTAGGAHGLMKTIGENVQTRRAMDGTVPEAPVQIQAQLKYITDPNANLDSVYAADPEAADKVTLPEGVVAYKHESGVLFSSNEAKGKAFEQDGNKDAKGTLGYLETKEEIMANTKVTDLRSVVARNAEGTAVGTEMTSATNAPNVEVAMQERYGKDVEIATLDGPQTVQLLQERQELTNEDTQQRTAARLINPDGGTANTGVPAAKPLDLPETKKGRPAEGPGSKSMRDDTGKLRPLGDLIQGALNGDITQEEIVAEAKKAGVDSRPTTKGAFPRQRIINAILRVAKDKRDDAGQKASYAQTQSDRKALEEASTDQLTEKAKLEGVSITPENPITSVNEKKGPAHRVATALLGKLNNTKGSFIGSSWEQLAFLFDEGTDTTKGKKEPSGTYGQRLLLAVKVKPGQKRADAIAEGLSAFSDHELSELANEFHLNNVERNKNKIIETAREDDVRQLLSDITDNEFQAPKATPVTSPRAEKKERVLPPTKQQKNDDDQAADLEEQSNKATAERGIAAVVNREAKAQESTEEQHKKRKTAQKWEVLHAGVRTRMEELFPKGSPHTLSGLIQLFSDIGWDSKYVRDEVVAQLTELKRFYETNNLNDHIIQDGEKFSTRVDKLITMTNSHESPTLRQSVAHSENRRFFDMLSLVFNTRQEDAANKELAGAAKLTLGKLLLRGRIDLTLISQALSGQKGFRRTEFASTYVDNFMEEHATEVYSALDMMARNSIHSAEKLFDMLKVDMANADGKAKSNMHFPSMMVTTPMMEQYVNSIMAMHDTEDRSEDSVMENIRKVFLHEQSDVAGTLASLAVNNIIDRKNQESYYAVASFKEEDHSRPVSADAPGISPIIERVSPNRSSINTFFHQMFRATMRFRDVFLAINTPPNTIENEPAVDRLARFRALKLNGSEYLEGKRIITVDFETHINTKEGYSLGNPDLSNVGYIKDSRFEILGLGVKEEGAETQYIQTDEEIAALVEQWRKDPNVLLVMHNAKFDAAIFHHKFGYMPNHMIDTMRLSKGVRFEKRMRHKLEILSQWMFPDNKDLQKIAGGVLKIEGMKKKDIAASPEHAAEFERYAIRDVNVTRDIAMKIAPLVHADELAHQSASIINDVTGQITNTQKERMYNGVFGDGGVLGKAQGQMIYARSLAVDGANLIEAMLEDNGGIFKRVMLDAVTIAQYIDNQKAATTLVEAFATLQSNLARMTEGTQPRLQEDLAPGEPSDLRRQYSLPPLPDSLVIFQAADKSWKTVGDARRAESLEKNEANKDSSIHNFIETAQDTLAEKRDQMVAVIEALEEEDSESAELAAEYVKDLMNDAHKNTKKEQGIGDGFNTVETVRSSAIVPGLESEASLESFAFGSNKTNFDKLHKASPHISLYEAIQTLSKELILLDKRLKEKKATYAVKHVEVSGVTHGPYNPQDAKFIEGLKATMEKIITERQLLREKARRLVETGHIEDYAGRHTALKGGASEEQHKEIKRELEAAIEDAGGKQIIEDTIKLFTQLKDAHGGNPYRGRNKTPNDEDPSKEIAADDPNETGMVDGLALDAVSKAEKQKFSSEVTFSIKDESDDPARVAADLNIGKDWATAIFEFEAVETFKNQFADHVVTKDTKFTPGWYSGDQESRRTSAQDNLPRTQGKGYDPSYARIPIAIPVEGGEVVTSYNLYGDSWTHFSLIANPKKTKQGPPKDAKEKSEAGQALERKVVLRKYFTKGVKMFGNLAGVQEVVANLLQAVGIKHNVVLTDTSNAVAMVKDLAASGIITNKAAKKLQAKLKRSYKRNQPAYVNMGEFAIIMMPTSITNSSVKNMAAITYSMAAHEVGHLVYDFSWANASDKNRASVLAAFAADREHYSEKSEAAAFKEWYADQVALALSRGAFASKEHITNAEGLNRATRKTGDAAALNISPSFRGLVQKMATPRDMLNLSSHFRELVQQLTKLWTAISGAFRSPLNETFAEYLDNIIMRGDISTQPAPETRGQVLNMTQFRTKSEIVTHNKFLKFGHKILGNVSSNFKRLDKNLADLLFQQAATTGSRTGEKSYENLHMELAQRYESLYSTAMTKIGRPKAVTQAFDDLNNGNATEHSLILRKMINEMNTDLAGYMPTYQVRNSMIPQAFDHHKVDGNREAFKALLNQHAVFKHMNDGEMESRIAYLLDGQGFNERTIAPGKPVGAHAFADLILAAVPYADLKEYLVREPAAIMSHYIASAAKRAGWEQTFGGYIVQDKELSKVPRPFGGKWDEAEGHKVWSPNKRWHEAMGRIEEKHGEAAVDEALTLLDGVMGRTGVSMNSKLRKSQDTLLNVVNMSILANSGVASIPELGMAIARASNLLSVKDMFKGLNLREARRIGMDIGTVLSNGLAQIQGNAANEAYNGTYTQKMASKFFVLNGQQAITKASRTFSTALGMRYLEKAADFNQHEELNAFHVTARQIHQWRALGKPAFTEGLSKVEADSVRAVNGAIMQFVTESSFRPSKFQNPAWGNNPYMKIAFHLKQFLYAITDILVMGLLRQAKRRFSDARGEGLLAAGAYSMMPIVVGGVAIAALTMFAIELRELLKGVDRTQNMGDTKYAMEVFSKSGTLGAFEIGYRILKAEDWDDRASAMVPTYGFGKGVVKSALSDDSALETVRRVTPFFAQYPNWWPAQ